MRLFLFASALLLALASFTPLPKPDQLPYDPDRPLTWDDFRPRAMLPILGYKAYTWSGIAIDLSSDDTGIHVNTYSYFVPSESWVEKDAGTPELLRHEQGHFDLTELYTRELRTLLEPYQNMDVSKFVRGDGQDSVQRLYDETFDRMNAEQERYDKETEHSVNREKQQMWDADIARRLRETR